MSQGTITSPPPRQFPQAPPPTPTPEPTPTPTPAGSLWTSIAWANGKERHLTSHHQFDPYDNTFEVAAGENRDWFIDGKGNCFASGARTRGYQHTKQDANVKYQWDDQYIHNSTLEGFSKQFFSRHNEGDPEENRNGGPTISFHNDSIDFADEHWHNERHGNDSKSLSTKIVNGQVTTLKIIGIKQVANNTVKYVFDIYVNGKLEWHKEHTSQHPEAAIKQSLYWRNRVNGDAPKNVQIKYSSISKI